MSSLNESDESIHLELLPAELQFLILTSIPNMKALRALLGASPRYLQVYRTCREVILSHVAWNHITPAALPIALDALAQRDNRKYGLYRTKQFASERTLKEPHEIPLETWERLLRFHQIVDCLISSFTSSRLVGLENAIHPQSRTFLSHESPDEHLNLSQLEYARLSRAFYHLELYAHLFYDSNAIRPGMIRQISFKRATTFLRSLRDWELEELLCVRSYMMERLIDCLNKFEDDFMKAYRKDRPCIMWPSRDTELSWPVCLFVNDNYIQDVWIECCLALGLEPFLALFSAETLPEKFNDLPYTDLDHPLMSTALNALQLYEPYSEEKVTAKMKRLSEIGSGNNTEQPNKAWFWAIKEPFESFVHNGCDTNDFECWGYVIWDHVRLERLGILTKSPSDISATIGTDWLIKRTPKSLEARMREQEEIWSQEELQSTLAEPRPMFNWKNIWSQ